jgi:hypothetical protein
LRIENWRPVGYVPAMNKPTKSSDADLWIAPRAKDVVPVAGYDAWLAQDMAAGLAEIDAGAVTPLAEVRKEFGLE